MISTLLSVSSPMSVIEFYIYSLKKSLALGEEQKTTVCEHKKQKISCGAGNVIEIIRASYGRTSTEICKSSAMRNTNCHATTSDNKVGLNCNGKESCELFASNSVFGDPCLGTFKYLDVEYRCQEKGKCF